MATIIIEGSGEKQSPSSSSVAEERRVAGSTRIAHSNVVHGSIVQTTVKEHYNYNTNNDDDDDATSSGRKEIITFQQSSLSPPEPILSPLSDDDIIKLNNPSLIRRIQLFFINGYSAILVFILHLITLESIFSIILCVVLTMCKFVIS